MSKNQLVKLCFLFMLTLMVGWVSVANTVPVVPDSLAISQEGLVVGAGSFACDFASGFSVGLGVASFFGCLACAVGSFVVGAAVLAHC